MKPDTTPATKGNLNELERKFDDRFSKIEGRMETQKQELLDRMDDDTKEIKRYFDVVAENYFKELLGANQDERSLVKDQAADHERRIRRLERNAGIVVV